MNTTLWAPWRIEYILGHKEEGCFLCDKLNAGDDVARLILHRGAHCFVIMNRYPYSAGHLMVAPYRHVAMPGEMTLEERTEMTELTTRCIAILEQALKPHGFNVGLNLGKAAGAGLKDHIHQHVVPRWTGDTNFMAALSAVRVIPQALEELYGQLQPLFYRS